MCLSKTAKTPMPEFRVSRLAQKDKAYASTCQELKLISSGTQERANLRYLNITGYLNLRSFDPAQSTSARRNAPRLRCVFPGFTLVPVASPASPRGREGDDGDIYIYIWKIGREWKRPGCWFSFGLPVRSGVMDQIRCDPNCSCSMLCWGRMWLRISVGSFFLRC